MEVLHDMPIQIEALTSGHQISDIEFTRWLDEEQSYLKSKKSEPEVDVLGIEYVELLTKYYNAQYSPHFVT